MSESKAKAPVQPGDIMALDTTIAAFVMLVEGAEDGFCDPKHGARVYFRWLAHPDAAKETTREWIWENTLQESAWLKVA